MQTRILVIAGRLAAGKTSAANFICERDDRFALLTISEVIRQSLQNKGRIGVDRQTLQDEGSRLVLDPLSFSHKILNATTTDKITIIDGLRSPETVIALNALVDVHVTVYLEAERSLRRSRYEHRRSPGEALFDDVDFHPIEFLTEGIRPLANGVIDASQPPEMIRDAILALCAQRCLIS